MYRLKTIAITNAKNDGNNFKALVTIPTEAWKHEFGHSYQP